MRSGSAAVVVALLLAAALSGISTPAAHTAPGPRLLVMLVVDQMRFEYLDRYAKFWTHGLKRLTTEAAVFDRGFYPYLNTVTCAGHATIATGAFPSTHGIIMNEWWHRTVARRMPCTDDPDASSLPYGGGARDRVGHSGHRLRLPTLADRLRAASPGSRVVTLSMKPRSSVMLAGHGGTAVTWFGDSNAWSTSSAFARQPLAEVDAFVAAHPVDRDRPVVWNRARNAKEYFGADESAFERPRPAWRTTFPHPLTGPPGTSASEFFNLWERSPYGDAYLGALTADLVRRFALGQREVVDFLGVSFSSLDYAGHDFGPNSHEVQDTLIRLDATLGQLFADLDQTVGRDRYLVALSADHGVADIPEARKARGEDAGRVVSAEVRKVAEAALVAAHGPGPHVAHVEYTNVYLTDAAKARAEKNVTWLKPLLDGVSAMAGVQRVFPSSGLDRRRASRDPIERAAALSYFPGESGEIVVVLKPNWIGSDTSTTTHGSMQPYDQHVPVILMGAPFTPGRYSTPASPADLAPTLAAVIKLALPGVDGKALAVAVR